MRAPDGEVALLIYTEVGAGDNWMGSILPDFCRLQEY